MNLSYTFLLGKVPYVLCTYHLRITHEELTHSKRTLYNIYYFYNYIYFEDI